MSLVISDLIDKFLKYKENIESFSSLSLRSYRMDLNQAFYNKQNTVFIEKQALSLVRDGLNGWGKLSLSSRNRKIACLKSFFGWLHQEGLTKTNYSHHLTCPKIPKKIPHFISLDEAIAVLKFINHQLKNNKQDKKLNEKMQMQKVLFLLLYGSGLRVSEACNLKWQNIFLADKKLLILGKGNKERYSILPEFSVDYLKHYKKMSENHIYVFGNKPLNPRTAYELINSLGQQAGLTNSLHPHALRHSYATHLLASGANLRTLQTLLGHESLQATEKYTHLGVDHLARLVDRTHPLSKLKIS